LALTAVLLVIHILNVLLGVVLGLLTVDEVHALGLGQLINLSTGKTNEHLLGELMGDWLACKILEFGVAFASEVKRTILALSVLEHLESTEGSGTS
jgi:hypothetical protein